MKVFHLQRADRPKNWARCPSVAKQQSAQNAVQASAPKGQTVWQHTACLWQKAITIHAGCGLQTADKVREPGLLPVFPDRTTGFDAIIAQCVVSDRNLACAIVIKDKTPSDRIRPSFASSFFFFFFLFFLGGLLLACEPNMVSILRDFPVKC